MNQRRNRLRLGAALALVASGLCAQQPVPAEGPRFVVPGQERHMAALGRMLALHHPASGPKETFWDQWLVPPALWPATAEGRRLRAAWRAALLARPIGKDGYVDSQVGGSIAHPQGWHEPFWNQAPGSIGWHFSFADAPAPPRRGVHLADPGEWNLERASSEGLIDGQGWRIELDGRKVEIESPPLSLSSFQVPYLQLQWAALQTSKLRPAIEWRRVGSDVWYRKLIPAPRAAIGPQLVRMFDHPKWDGRISQIRISLGNEKPGGQLLLRALFGQYDTRHNVNSQALLRGSADYFWWTGDVEFLREQLPRLRRALLHLFDQHGLGAENLIRTTWSGHDARPGIGIREDGVSVLRPGHGLSNNSWAPLPFGNLDAYATFLACDAVRTMADLEQAGLDHPGWRMPSTDDPRLEPSALWALSEAISRRAGQLFWNEDTGRFVACIDSRGQSHDYGYTFLNLDAIQYQIADREQAESILSWIEGSREVAGDTSREGDIYHWRFAPRTSTRHNLEWYGWYRGEPDTVGFGDRIEDGGALLATSYDDIMARLRLRGPDDAWRRLRDIAQWFEEVEQAGGYAAYYDGTRPGVLQTGDRSGSLGIDQAAFASVLVPQIMLTGFLGFTPEAEGFSIDPRLPADWPSLRIEGIQFQDRVLSIEVTRDAVRIESDDDPEGPMRIIADGVEHRWRQSRSLRIALER